MARQFYPVLTTTVTASADIAPNRFVTFAGTQAAAAAHTLGVARSGGAAGDAVPVDAMGLVVVEAGGPIAAGGAVETDAQGRAVAQAAGPVVARSIDGAAKSGALTQVLLIPN